MSDGCDSPYFTLKLWCDSPIFYIQTWVWQSLFYIEALVWQSDFLHSDLGVTVPFLHWSMVVTVLQEKKLLMMFCTEKSVTVPLKGSSIEICNELIIECTVLITPPPPSPPASHRPTPHPAHTVVCCCVMQNYHQFCVMVDQSREMNVEESMAKRQWSTDDFNQVLGTHTEMVCCGVWNGLMACCHVWNGLLWRVKWYVVMCEMVCCDVWNGLLWGVKWSVCCDVWNGLLWGVKWSVVRCEVVCCEVWNSVVMCKMVCCDVWNGLLWLVKWSVVMCEIVCLLWCVCWPFGSFFVLVSVEASLLKGFCCRIMKSKEKIDVVHSGMFLVQSEHACRLSLLTSFHW